MMMKKQSPDFISGLIFEYCRMQHTQDNRIEDSILKYNIVKNIPKIYFGILPSHSITAISPLILTAIINKLKQVFEDMYINETAVIAYNEDKQYVSFNILFLDKELVKRNNPERLLMENENRLGYNGIKIIAGNKEYYL